MDKISFHAKNFELTDAIKSYAIEKINSLNKYFDKKDESLHFIMRLGKTTNHHQNGKIFFVEISIHSAEKNYDYKVETADVYAGIDEIKDEIANMVSNHNKKVKNLQKKGAQEFKKQLRKFSDE